MADSGADPAADATRLPSDVVDEAERLTRLARRAVDEDERIASRDRRTELLSEYGFVARLRESDETLVCHPEHWLEDDTVRTDRIEDTDRAVEVPLSGPDGPDDWAAVDARNRRLVAAVKRAHGPVHGANADTFADFMSNQYARPMATATAAELAEFLHEYVPRNAWPSARERAAIGRSLELVFETADEPVPPFTVPDRLR